MKFTVLPRTAALWPVVALAAALLWGCGTTPVPSGQPGAPGTAGKPAGNAPLQVATTVGMITDLAKRIGGPHVHVHGLMGPGVDPHTYKSTEADIRSLKNATVVFYNGLHLEGTMVEVFERLHDSRGLKAIAVGAGLPDDKYRSMDGHHDPHIWFDVSLWSHAAERVREGLVAAAPQHAETLNANAAALQKEFTELHAWCKTELAKIPRERRVLVTAHDAFGYFGRAYDLDVLAIQGISTESEASLKELNALIDTLVQRKIKAVFVESSVSHKNVEALVDGCKAKGHTLVIGGELFSDAMGAEGTPEGTYPGMVRHNVNTIVKALQ